MIQKSKYCWTWQIKPKKMCRINKTKTKLLKTTILDVQDLILYSQNRISYEDSLNGFV